MVLFLLQGDGNPRKKKNSAGRCNPAQTFICQTPEYCRVYAAEVDVWHCQMRGGAKEGNKKASKEGEGRKGKTRRGGKWGIFAWILDDGSDKSLLVRTHPWEGGQGRDWRMGRRGSYSICTQVHVLSGTSLSLKVRPVSGIIGGGDCNICRWSGWSTPHA